MATLVRLYLRKIFSLFVKTKTMKIKVKNGDLVDSLNDRQKNLILNKTIMPKFKMVEPNKEAKEGEYGWIETELESDNLVDAMKEALASKEMFVGQIEH